MYLFSLCFIKFSKTFAFLMFMRIYLLHWLFFFIEFPTPCFGLQKLTGIMFKLKNLINKCVVLLKAIWNSRSSPLFSNGTEVMLKKWIRIHAKKFLNHVFGKIISFKGICNRYGVDGTGKTALTSPQIRKCWRKKTKQANNTQLRSVRVNNWGLYFPLACCVDSYPASVEGCARCAPKIG